MAAKEKAKDSKYVGLLSAVRVNKSESLVAGKLWYRNLCKRGQLASPVASGSLGEENDLELLAGTKMGLWVPESPLPKSDPGSHTDEQIADGFTLISSLLYCSSEAIELFKFYNETIIIHSPATVLQATINNLTPGLLRSLSFTVLPEKLPSPLFLGGGKRNQGRHIFVEFAPSII